MSVAWSADQRRALSGSDDKTVRLWDVETGRCLRVLEGHTDSVWSVAWSADQRRALSGSGDKTVRLWDVETGRCLRVLEGHTDGVMSVAWSADQRRALSGSSDKTVRLWDVETGRCLRVLEGHTANVWSVAWSADQRRALSGSSDNTVRLWDVETGRCLRVLEGHTGDVRSVAWSADGRRAFSGDVKGGIRVWDLSEFVTEARTSEAPASHPWSSSTGWRPSSRRRAGIAIGITACSPLTRPPCHSDRAGLPMAGSAHDAPLPATTEGHDARRAPSHVPVLAISGPCCSTHLMKARPRDGPAWRAQGYKCSPSPASAMASRCGSSPS